MAGKANSGVVFVEPEQKMCARCRMVKSIAKDFFPCNSPMYDGKIPICNKCLVEVYHGYYIEYHGERQAIKRICMAFNLLWDEDKFKKANKQDTPVSRFDAYLKTIRLVKTQSFDDTLLDGFSFGEDTAYSDDPEENARIKKASIEKWGAGFSPDEYKTLDDHYKMLTRANPNRSENQEIFITDLCYTKMQQLAAIKDRNTEDFKKLTETYQKVFQMSGLKASQTADGAVANPLGAIIDMIEQYTPAEYYKDLGKYQDYSGYDEYRRRFIDRPVDNIINGTIDRDTEYFVSDADEDDAV